MKSDKYKDMQFAQFYQGLVTGEEPEDQALVFAHPQNIAKLGPDTKQISCDGTFRTAPSLRVGHLYQILIILAMYRDHMFPVVKAVMTGGKRSLYDSVFAKVKSLLPKNVKPTLVICVDCAEKIKNETRARRVCHMCMWTGVGGMPHTHSTIEFDRLPYIPYKDNKYPFICL